MEEFIAQMMLAVGGYWNGLLNSTFLFVMKILIGVYTFVLFLDLVFLVYLGDVRKQLRSMKYGSSSVTENRGKRRREWKKVFRKLDEDHEAEWKLAVLEAENLVFKSLGEVGYQGDTFKDRIDQIDPYVTSSVDTVRSVHTFRNKIVHEDDLRITVEQAKEAITVYYDFLGDLGAV